MGRVRIIAELGSSAAPEWDFDKWCAAAAAVGADAVKAQMFVAEHFPRSEWDSKRPLEFPRKRLDDFVRCAHAYGLAAGVSVFDDAAVELAYQSCDFVKLAAREQANGPLMRTVFLAGLDRKSTPLYRSISDLSRQPHTQPASWTTCFAIQRYPAGIVRSLFGIVRAHEFFRRHSVRRWGYSSHTTGTFDCVFAAYLGAAVIEKHFAISPHNLEAGHSLQPQAFANMVTAVRRVERKS